MEENKKGIIKVKYEKKKNNYKKFKGKVKVYKKLIKVKY